MFYDDILPALQVSLLALVDCFVWGHCKFGKKKFDRDFLEKVQALRQGAKLDFLRDALVDRGDCFRFLAHS